MGLLSRVAGGIGTALGAGVDAFAKSAMRADDPANRSSASMAMTLADKPATLPPDPTGDDPKGLLFDPFALIDQLGYRDRPTGLTYQTLREMAKRVPTYTAVLQTRLTQVKNFGQRQKDPREPGYGIILRDEKATPTRQDEQRMRQLEDWLMQTGTVWSHGRDNFKTFLHKITRDSLVLDQACFEIQHNRKGEPWAFYAMDAGGMRLADVPPGAEANPPLDMVKYVQVYDEMVIAEYGPHQLCFGVRNPRSDIRVNGYGYCLHPDSRIATDLGLIRIEDLAGEQFRVVLGGKLYPANAFASGKKAVWTLRLKDGREIKASPDHRFYCVAADGTWAWKRLADITPGDFVASDLEVSEGGKELPPLEYRPEGRARSDPWKIDRAGDDLWEVLGWFVGDGSFSVKTGKNCGKASTWIYAEGEEEIAARHREILSKYDLPAPFYARSDGLCGEIKFNHEGFGRWLISEVGIKPRGGGLPTAVFEIPLSQRAAFLRGLFSADGHLGNSDTPVLGCTDRPLLQDVQRLLMSLGIRSRWRHQKVKKDIGCGRRDYDEGGLYVYDKERFFEAIGFYQDHKQPVLDTYQGTRADTAAPQFSARIASRLKDQGIADRRIRGLLETPPRWGATRRWLSDRVGALSCPERNDLLPDLAWGQTEVVAVDESSDVVEMYDVSVDSEFHGFTVDGVVVHNSELEMLINVITSTLWAFEYNKKQFSQGTLARGLLNFKGTIPDKKIDSFRRQWKMMIAGIDNAHKTPMTNVDEVQWIDLHTDSQKMGYSDWMDWLIKITCAVMQFDPTEINFSYGNTGQSNQMFGTPVEQKVKESKDKGLKPLLEDLALWINTHLIWPLDPALEFAFLGLSAKSTDQAVDLAKKQVTYLKTVDELRAEEDLEPLPDGTGAVILDPTWLQNKQAAEMAQQQQQGEQPPDQDMGDVASLTGEGDEGGEEDDGGFSEMFGEEQPSEKSLRAFHARRQQLVTSRIRSPADLKKSEKPGKATVKVYEIEL